MKLSRIDGDDLRNLFRFGLKEVMRHRVYFNEINVFPVADGDTGTNLAMTLRAMAENPESTRSFGDMIGRISESGLSNARGNSGLIFASYFSGIALEGGDYETVDISEFSVIAKRAVSYVYQAVEKPVEGTMISVIRDWADYLSANHGRFVFFDDLFQEAYHTAEASLAKTPELLDVLRRNKVVDSGAAGFVGFLKGINHFFAHGLREEEITEPYLAAEPISEAYDSLYRYCTEVALRGVIPPPESLRKELESLGDSLIVTSHKDKLRIHLHSNDPGAVIHQALKYGELIEQKVDDMQLQNLFQTRSKGGIALVTDSIADIPDALLLKHRIHTVPLTLLVDEIPYLDKVTIGLDRLFALMSTAKSYPTSSQPESGRIREILERALINADTVIVISVADKLSGTYGVFKREAERLDPGGKRITVVDSRLNSGAQGLVVQRAAEWIDMGFSHEEVIEKIRALIPETKIYVCLETLANAVRGGRVSNTVGKIGMALGARPIMTLGSEGQGAAFGCGFSLEGMTRRIFSRLRQTQKKKGILSYSIVHGNNPALVHRYVEFMKALTGRDPEFVMAISSVTAIHSGPGCVAVSVVEGRKGAFYD